MPQCPMCGDRKRQNKAGVCAWRAGCEHRVMRQQASERRVVEEAERIVASASHRSWFETMFRQVED